MSSNSGITDNIFGGSSHASAFLAHEVRNLVNVAILSVEVLKTTGASLMGRDGQVLLRSLSDLRTLVNRALSDTRTARSGGGRGAIDVGGLINEIEAAATLEARAKGIRLVVPPVPDGLVVEADRHELGAAVKNLLQNAVKFTRPGTAVDLRVGSSGDRVRIEVQDECGGLAAGCQDDLFLPYEQRGRDRSGLGLGLAFSRNIVETSGGTISVRNLPGHGCVFAIDLPRALRAGACAVREREHVDCGDRVESVALAATVSSHGHDGVCNATHARGDQGAIVAS